MTPRGIAFLHDLDCPKEVKVKIVRLSARSYHKLFTLVCDFLNHKQATYGVELSAIIATFQKIGVATNFRGVFDAKQNLNIVPSIVNTHSAGDKEIGHWYALTSAGKFDPLKSKHKLFQHASTSTCGHHAVAFVLLSMISPLMAQILNDTVDDTSMDDD